MLSPLFTKLWKTRPSVIIEHISVSNKTLIQERSELKREKTGYKNKTSAVYLGIKWKAYLLIYVAVHKCMC